ncbi:HAMP domain-containing protein [Streptomyces sp. NPDC085929]|uniref:HAMP domain-containing protein n=1 Tax=Streptomyces sp. NPDC085929 TaxID=3365739 RepID=UPI0037D1FD13
MAIAGVVWAIGGRVEQGATVPTAVLDSQLGVTAGAAQHVRRSLHAGELNLAQLASELARTTDPSTFSDQVKDFRDRYQRRYRSVFVLDSGRHVLARAGSEPHPGHVPDNPLRAGTTEAVGIDKMPVVLQYAPFALGDGGAIAVAEYDLANLRYVLDALLPATAWVVNAKGEVLASTAGFTAFQQLGREEVRRAAQTASDQPGVSLGGSFEEREIVASAPVRGSAKLRGPTWRVVTARSVDTIVLPQTQARDQALLVALAVATVTVGVFGWLYVMWLRPLRRLVYDAERIADRDLRSGVEVRRYDELGRVARSVERIRIDLVRSAAAGADVDQAQVPRIMPRQVP